MASEPITATAAAAVAAGASTVLVTVLGVEPQGVFWVAVGASVGVVATPPQTRVRAAATFIATIFAGALLARIGARHMFDGDPTWRNVLALFLGATFPILRDRVSVAAPKIFDRMLGRQPGGGE